MGFGEKLKMLREAAGMTQAELANASGVPIGTIRDYEQTKRDPLLPTAAKLAQALGVSLDAFAGCITKEEVDAKQSPSKNASSTPPSAKRKK